MKADKAISINTKASNTGDDKNMFFAQMAMQFPGQQQYQDVLLTSAFPLPGPSPYL